MFQILIYFFIFIFGLIIGSFLNCLIYRLKTGENIVSSRSHCVKCGHKLDWKDLMPVFSFLFLRGKCQYCSKKISWQYPAVEIATGLLFLLIFNFQFSIFNQASIFNFQTILEAAFLLVIGSFLVIIFVYDLKHYLIPDKIIYLAIVAAFLYQIFRILDFGHWDFIWHWDFVIGILKSFLSPVLSAFFASAFFGTIVLISGERWMGWGDVFLTFFMGLFLGFPNILLALFLAFTLGALVGIVLIAFGRKKMKSQVPFAPFLVLGLFIALFWGEKIIAWYLGLLRI